VVSEIGDHFNSIAVLSLTLPGDRLGAGGSAVMIARVLPASWRGLSRGCCWIAWIASGYDPEDLVRCGIAAASFSS